MDVPQSRAMDTFSPLVSVRPSWHVAQLPEPEKCEVVKLVFSAYVVKENRKISIVIDARISWLIIEYLWWSFFVVKYN